MGFQLSPPFPGYSGPPRCPGTPTKLHIGLAGPSLGQETQRKECQPSEGLAAVQGRGPTAGPVSSCPRQASTTLWWQECGRHPEARPPLSGLETQVLSPGPPGSPAETTFRTSHRRLALQHISTIFVVILSRRHTYDELHRSLVHRS